MMYRPDHRRARSGITLIEMMVVVAIIALIAGVSYPAVTSGIDSLRLTQATDGIATFLNSALNRAERRQQVMEITISIPGNLLRVRSNEAGYVRTFTMPSGVTIQRILPEMAGEKNQVRQFFLYPGGVPPGAGVEIVNLHRSVRRVHVDPISGIAQVERE